MKTARQIFTSVRALGKERIWLLGILTGGHFVIHWFQQLFPVILPSIKSGLGLSNVEVGALTSAQQMIMGLAQLPVGLLADSMVGHRANILALSLVAMGAAYFLLGSPVFAWALLGSGLIGLGTALWHPTAAASLSNSFPERRATALSIHGTGATISDTITPLFVGALLASFSWQTVARLQLLPGLLFALMIWRALTGVFADAESHSPRDSTQLVDVVGVIKNPAFLGVSAATGLLSMGRLVILTFLPIYLQEHLHYSAFALGVFVALMHALGTVSQPALGLLSDRFGRKAVLVPSCLLLGLFFALLASRAGGHPPRAGNYRHRPLFLHAFQYHECRGDGRRWFERSGIDLRPDDIDHAARGHSDTDDYRLLDWRVGNQVLVCPSRSFSVPGRPGIGTVETVPRLA